MNPFLWRSCGAALLLLACAPFSTLAEESDATVSGGEATPISVESSTYRKRPYVLSVALREEYDDNVNTSENDKLSSFKTIVEPQIVLELPDGQTIWNFTYTEDTIFYHKNAPQDDVEFNHNVNFNVDHDLSHRASIHASDRFQYAQQPAITDANSIYRREGNFFENDGGVGGTFNITRRLSVNADAHWDKWKYEDELFAPFLDRDVYSFSTGLSYQVSSVTTASANYSYQIVDFDKRPDDATAHAGYLGLTHVFTPLWDAAIQGGAQLRQTKGAPNDTTAPFVGFVTRYRFQPMCSLTLGYNTSLEETDVNTFNYSQTQRAYLKVNTQLTHDLGWQGEVDYVLVELPGDQRSDGSFSDETENTLILETALFYQFATDWYLTMSYSYSHVSSSLALRSYDRNIISSGVRFVY